MIDKSLLGNKLRRLREIKGISREAIAEVLHVDVSTYGRYETGHNLPPPDHLKTLAEFHDVSLDSLVSPDPIVFTIHNANGTQVANGAHARFVQHVVSEEFVKDMLDRIDQHMKRQEHLNGKLIDLLDRITSRPGQ